MAYSPPPCVTWLHAHPGNDDLYLPKPSFERSSNAPVAMYCGRAWNSICATSGGLPALIAAESFAYSGLMSLSTTLIDGCDLLNCATSEPMFGSHDQKWIVVGAAA
jgi:hypothetical protein